MIEAVFWIGALLVAHTYVGHPLLVYTLARLRPRPWRQGRTDHSLAVIVCAFNEQSILDEKIRNLLAQDFDGAYEVLIASDGSTDDTNAIARSFENTGKVRLFDFPTNRGKSAMINDIVPQLGCDLVVFSDATSMWAADTLHRIVAHFADDEVGCIGADVRFVRRSDGAVESGQGAYWRYERFLRIQGALAGTNVVVSGTCYAMRRALFQELPGEIGEDLANPVAVAFAGKRVVFDPSIVVDEVSNVAHDSEVRMRRRIALQNIAATFRYWRLLDPRNGFAAYQLFAHKYLRAGCWLAMLAVLAANVLLVGSLLYNATLAMQGAFYAGGVAGIWYHRRTHAGKLLYVPYYFLLMNLAYVAAFAQYLGGQRKPTWEPER